MKLSNRVYIRNISIFQLEINEKKKLKFKLISSLFQQNNNKEIKWYNKKIRKNFFQQQKHYRFINTYLKPTRRHNFIFFRKIITKLFRL